MAAMNERLVAVVGSCLTTAGMMAVLHFGGNRLALKHALDSKDENERRASTATQPSVSLTPWVNISLSPPHMLNVSMLTSVAIKAILGEGKFVISDELKLPNGNKTLYGIALGIFACSAALHYSTVKYMVKIGTPVPHGYEVKTLCRYGPFQYLKHPIYMSNFLASCAAALSHDCMPCLLSPLLYGTYLFSVVIPREEKYLIDKFGDSYKNREYFLGNLWNKLFG